MTIVARQISPFGFRTQMKNRHFHRTPTGRLKQFYLTKKPGEFTFEGDDSFDHCVNNHVHYWYIFNEYLEKPKLRNQIISEVESIVEAWASALTRHPDYPQYGFTIYLCTGEDLIMAVARGTSPRFPYDSYWPTPESGEVKRETHFVGTVAEALEGARSFYPEEVLPSYLRQRSWPRKNFEKLCGQAQGDPRKLAKLLGIRFNSLRWILLNDHGDELFKLQKVRKKLGKPPLRFSPDYLDYPQWVYVHTVRPGHQ